jgi:hypothetical protein
LLLLRKNDSYYWTFEEDSNLLYLGMNYPLTILQKQSRNTIKFIDEEFIFRLKSAKVHDLIQKLYQDIKDRLSLP